MIRYIGRRLAYLVPTWIGISLLAFVIGNLAPGDPARAYFQRTQGRPPTQVELEQVRTEFGLDKPPVQRYAAWVAGAVRGDLGTAFSTGRPVTSEIASRFPATLQLTVAGMTVALAIALPVGVVAALHRNRLLDQLLRGSALLGASLPSFFLAYLLIIVFSVQLSWLPSIGRGDGDLRHLVLPALALGLGESAILARLLRSSVLETLGEPYVRAARAKGLPEWRVLGRHVLGNSLSAVVTQAALTFGYLLAFSAIIEVIFVWPGLGRLVLSAISQRDYPLIQGFVVFAGTLYVLLNLLVDLVYLWLDPRVRLVDRPTVWEVPA